MLTAGLTSDGSLSWIEDTVESLIEHNASALILNTGKYLQPGDITPRTSELCAKNSFPLFLMPWDVHIADLMQNVCNIIFSENRKEEIIGRYFSELLIDHPDYHEKCAKLKDLGFDTDRSYNTLEVANIPSSVVLRSRMKKMGMKGFVMTSGERYTVILQDCSDSQIYDFLEKIYSYYGAARGDEIREGAPVIGMGEAETSLEKLRFTYQNGVNALKIAQRNGINFFRFKDLGFYQILLSIPDTDLLKRLHLEYLGAIENYDRENSTQLVETLRMYLNCNGSVNETATRMYTHRNTINYRMRKVRELFPFDMDDPDSAFILKMAFYIKDYLI